MPRSVNSVAAKARRKKILKSAKGYFGRRKNVHTVAKNAVEKGVMRCPEIGRMLNFESPWDGIFLMERMVRWSTFGGPLV